MTIFILINYYKLINYYYMSFYWLLKTFNHVILNHNVEERTGSEAESSKKKTPNVKKTSEDTDL